MPRIVFLNADGRRTEVEASVGDSLMRAAQDNGVEGLVAECGGSLSCATCHAYVALPFVDRIPAASEDEQLMIECAVDVRPNSRLSCQVFVTPDMDGLEVEIPASQY